MPLNPAVAADHPPLSTCTAARCAMPARPVTLEEELMKTPRRSLLLGLAVLALAGCASKPDLSLIQDPDVDFRSYRSFAFIPGKGESSLIDRRLLAAARSQLERRGYAFDELDPDLLVNIAAEMEQRRGLRSVPGAFPAWNGVETEDYRLGRMVIDLVDTRRRQVVWHGAAEGRVSAAMLRDAGAGVETAVAAVFDGFPVKAGMPAAAKAGKPQ
jgi:hypothetical protein